MNFNKKTFSILTKSSSVQVTIKLQYFQPAITWSKLTIETLEQDVKYVQS